MLLDSLFDPYDPPNERPINVESWTELTYSDSGDVARPYGRPDPVVVTSARAMPAGTLVLATLELDEMTWLQSLLATGRIIGFKPASPDYGLPATVYLHVGKASQARVGRKASSPERRWTLEVQMVTAPVVA